MRVVAHIHAKPESADLVKDILIGLIAPTRAEDGCKLYELMVDQESPAEFCFVEEWTSKAHLEAHLNTAHFNAAGEQLQGLVAAPTDIKCYDFLA